MSCMRYRNVIYVDVHDVIFVPFLRGWGSMGRISPKKSAKLKLTDWPKNGSKVVPKFKLLNYFHSYYSCFEGTGGPRLV